MEIDPRPGLASYCWIVSLGRAGNNEQSITSEKVVVHLHGGYPRRERWTPCWHCWLFRARPVEWINDPQPLRDRHGRERSRWVGSTERSKDETIG